VASSSLFPVGPGTGTSGTDGKSDDDATAAGEGL
jgi:hypothetical protein